MDDLIQALDDLTQHTINGLAELTYEELAQIVDDRQIIVDQIQQTSADTITDAQKQRVHIILESDAIILQRMMSLQVEARDWLEQRNRIKAQRQAYESSYAPDSILMDRLE